MKKVFVNGYGSIGSRIAKFVKEDSDIDVIGIGKHSPDERYSMLLMMDFQFMSQNQKVMISKTLTSQDQLNLF